MSLRKIYIATIIATLPTTGVFAAALERSNQSIQAFLEPGNYIEAGFNVTDQTIKGKTTTNVVGNVGNSSRNLNIGEVGDTYFTPKVAAKVQINEQLSVGLLYDQPFAINTTFNQAIRYFATTANKSQFKLDTKDITLLFGYKPTENLTVFAGPTYQSLDGNLNIVGVHNTGTTPGDQNPVYFGKFDDDSYGWVAGLALNTLDNKLKSSITYRSEHNYSFYGSNEVRQTLYSNYMTDPNAKNKMTLPQSVNLETNYQITSNTNLEAFVRWINWKNFELDTPYLKARSANAQGASQPNSFDLRGIGYNPIEYKN